MRRTLAALGVGLAALGTVSPAPADDAEGAAAEARRRYNLGTQAYAAKRFVDAALNFEAAARERPHAVTLFTAGLAWEQANQPERAADDLARALEVSGLSPAQQANARERLAGYEAVLGTALVVAPETWRVQLDAFTEVSAPARLHGTAGVHALVVRVPGRAVARRDVILETGQTARVELDASAFDAPPAVTPRPPDEAPAALSRPAAPPSPPSARSGDLRAPVGWAIAGAGVTALGAGALLGCQALGARDAYDAAPSRAALDHARGLEAWTTAAFVTGGVLAAGGLALALWPSPRGDGAADAVARVGRAGAVRARVEATPGGAAITGSF